MASEESEDAIIEGQNKAQHPQQDSIPVPPEDSNQNTEESEVIETTEESDATTSSVWGLWSDSVTASWRQAVEATGDAFEVTGDILSFVTEDTEESTKPGVLEQCSEEDNEAVEYNSGEEEIPITPDPSLNSMGMGWSWSKVKSTFVEQTKASLKQAENVVEQSMESLKQMEEYGSSVVNQTRSSIKIIVGSGEFQGDCQEDENSTMNEVAKPYAADINDDKSEKVEMFAETAGDEGEGNGVDLFASR